MSLQVKFRTQGCLDNGTVNWQGLGIVQISSVDLHCGGDPGIEKPETQDFGEALMRLTDGKSRALVAHDADETVHLTHLGRLSV